jgi:ATP-dependent Clp protease protease subunit
VIEEAMERDKFMLPDEAKAFGLIDHVVDKRPPALGDQDKEKQEDGDKD